MGSYSKHLTDQENHNLQNQLGPREENLSTAVVQLLFATNTRPSTWEVKITGVACFVKDSNRRGFYIEVTFTYIWQYDKMIDKMLKLYGLNIA